MGGQTGVFAWQNAAGIGHKLAQQIDVLVVKSIHCEIDFWFRAWGADFHCPALGSTALAASRPVSIGFTRHKLLSDFAVQSVAAQEAIILHQLDFFSLKLFIARGEITR